MERWFEVNRRELAWRAVGPDGRRDPYHALVAETMAQQTQLSRVVERFGVFVERFPRVEALAAADESEVLALWAGLGYYRRAKNLHRAAKAIAAAGRFPSSVSELKSLPGVGGYTAGALASIVFGERAAMVDGNVARVLVRVEMPAGAKTAGDAGRAKRERWAWERSGELVAAAADPGAFNEGLMELGATVCLPAPRTALCETCPVSSLCRARAAGVQGDVPPAKPGATRVTVWADAVVVTDRAGRVLVEQRPAKGMWAGLWQVVTVESSARAATGAGVAKAVGVKGARRVGGFDHVTSHRLVKFGVWVAKAGKGFAPRRGEWRGVNEVLALGISSAQRRVIEIGVHAEHHAPRPSARAGGGTGGTQRPPRAPRGMLSA